MSMVNIMSGSFCKAEEVAQGVAQGLELPLVRDEDLIGRVAQKNGLDAHALRRAIFGKPSLFNPFSHEKERAVGLLRLGMAELAQEAAAVFLGSGSLLLPRDIGHVLDVCLIADAKKRVERAARELGLGEKEAVARVHKDDEAAFRWAEYALDKEPWDAALYDILVPTDKTDTEAAVKLILEHASNQALAPTARSRRQADDNVLVARVAWALAEAGHNPKDLEVKAAEGQVGILVNKKVMMLGRLSEELEGLAKKVPGVEGVDVEAGPGYYQADVYRRADFQLPSKVLLVDDEREFVQTLSERLMLREIGSAVVFDGTQALKVVAEDEPEVIVLDLKMPGIDGVEVLKRIKTDYPNVEVIILTGHGSERDRQTCMELGAFAYLEKPVDIDALSATMQEAYAKIRSERG